MFNRSNGNDQHNSELNICCVNVIDRELIIIIILIYNNILDEYLIINNFDI